MEAIPFSFEYKAYSLGFKVPVFLGKLKAQERPIIHLKVNIQEYGPFFAEIAPLPSFGTEGIDAALQFCKSFSGKLTSLQTLATPLRSLPCCQSALERALYLALETTDSTKHRSLAFDNTALLMTQPDTCTAVEGFLQKGFQSFKLKIGLLPFAEETAILKQVLSLLPTPRALRLDANGRLSVAQARAYLDWLEGRGLAFLEQPLPAGEEEAMLELGRTYSTAIAWDESLVSLASLLKASQKGFRGVHVIKPSLLGSISGFLSWFKTQPAKAIVYSSAFETSLGLDNLLGLASLAPTALPVGAGTLAFLEPSPLVWHTFGTSVVYQPGLSQEKSAALFERS